MSSSAAMHLPPGSRTDRDEYIVEPAFFDVPSHVRFWLIATGAVFLDLWSKDRAFRTLKPNEIHPFWPGIIDLHRSLNDGAVFGSFTGYTAVFVAASVVALVFVVYLFAHSARTQWSLHVALALILAGAMGNLYDRAVVKADVVTYTTPDGRSESRIGTVLGDPNGPMISLVEWPDRANEQIFVRSNVSLRRQGVVRDFIKFVPRFPLWVPRLGGRDVWPWVFNVADSALVSGVVVLILHTWLDRKFHGRRESAGT